MSPRYLEFRADRSFGLSNARMGLEIGVGLAHLTRRTLVYYDMKPLWQGSHPVVPMEGRRGGATILDLYEVPVPTLPESERAGISGLGVRELDWPDLFACAFRHPAAPADDARFAAFLNRRPTVVGFSEQDDAAPVLRFANRSLSLYSYFFYLPDDLHAELRRTIARVRPREPYRRLGEDIAAAFGDFNAVHIRLGDFTKIHYRDAAIAPQAIVENLSGVMPRDEALLICTDASADAEFFAPILAAYPNAVMLEQFVLREPAWRERLRDLPFNGDPALALVSQIVAGRARVFAGSLYSTFTAMIHRERGLRSGDERFLFVFNPLGERAPFRDGAFAERPEGIFAWNRFPYARSSESYAWFREWPEAFR